MRLNYNNYEVDFELYKKDNFWVAEIESYNDNLQPLSFRSILKDDCIQRLVIFMQYKIDNNLIKSYQDQEYKVWPAFEDVLYSVRELNIGYHVTDTSKRQNIFEKGLIGSETAEKDVIAASELINKHKPFWVPKWVDRRKALYAYPFMNNSHLSDKRPNCDLYAINLKIDECWVGTQGLGGFCLDAGEDYTSEEYRQYNIQPQWIEKHNAELVQHAKDYWWYSCSLKNYIRNDIFVRYKDRQYGLDEILILHPIKQFELIGSWNENGVFYKNEKFEKYVKPKFKHNYQNILNKY
jgi:hypothetical protein